MKLTFLNSENSVEISDPIFSTPMNLGLLHQVIVAYQAAARSGTKAQKTRGEVSGSGKKLWKQKGTGRARCGDIRNPIWRGGGVIFAAKPRHFAQKVNKKVYQKALAASLAEMLRENRLFAITPEAISVPSSKTKELAKKLQSFSLSGSLLIVDHMPELNLYLAGRNIPNLSIMPSASVHPIDLIGHKYVLMTEAALKDFERRLSRPENDEK